MVVEGGGRDLSVKQCVHGMEDLSGVMSISTCLDWVFQMFPRYISPSGSSRLFLIGCVKDELLYPPQTVFVGGYTVFTLSDRVSETFLCPKRFCVRNVLFL